MTSDAQTGGNTPKSDKFDFVYIDVTDIPVPEYTMFVIREHDELTRLTHLHGGDWFIGYGEYDDDFSCDACFREERLASAIGFLNQRYNAGQSTNKRLHEKVDQLETYVDILEGDIVFLKKERDGLREENEALKQECVELRAHNQELLFWTEKLKKKLEDKVVQESKEKTVEILEQARKQEDYAQVTKVIENALIGVFASFIGRHLAKDSPTDAPRKDESNAST